MSDTSNLPPRSGAYDEPSAAEDRMLPIVVHTLHLLVFATGISPIIGVIIAYMGRKEPESWRTSHYEFAIWTFWLAMAGAAIGWLLIGVGIPLLLALGTWASSPSSSAGWCLAWSGYGSACVLCWGWCMRSGASRTRGRGT
jgi:uncharacterized membrane protein